MQTLSRYLVEYCEQIFVLIILVSVACINYFIPYKLAFLNFYFIPVLFAAYYLGVRSALLGSVLCTLLVGVHVYYFPSFFMPELTQLDLWMNIVAWSSFLILTGAVVGQLTSHLKTEVEHVKELNRDLSENKAKLEAAKRKLKDYSENLENKVENLTKKVEELMRTRKST